MVDLAALYPGLVRDFIEILNHFLPVWGFYLVFNGFWSILVIFGRNTTTTTTTTTIKQEHDENDKTASCC